MTLSDLAVGQLKGHLGFPRRCDCECKFLVIRNIRRLGDEALRHCLREDLLGERIFDVAFDDATQLACAAFRLEALFDQEVNGFRRQVKLAAFGLEAFRDLVDFAIDDLADVVATEFAEDDEIVEAVAEDVAEVAADVAEEAAEAVEPEKPAEPEKAPEKKEGGFFSRWF